MDKNMVNKLNWQKNNASLRRIEMASLVLMICCLVLAVLMDIMHIDIIICEKLNISPIMIDDFCTLSLTVLQIQASISTVGIALIALISGFMSEEYHGISVSDYFLNIKPRIFKQNNIIIGLLILTAGNVALHFFKMYNAVIAVLWVSCIIIIVSVIELYDAFKGKTKIIGEIDAYIDYMIFSDEVYYEKKCEIIRNYCCSVPKMNEKQYEEYKTRYKKGLCELLKGNPEPSIKEIYDNSCILINSFLYNDDIGDIKYRAYDILNEVYLVLFNYLKENKKHINADFSLYEDSCDEILKEMINLSKDRFNTYVKWRDIAVMVSYVNVYIHKDNITDIISMGYVNTYICWYITSSCRAYKLIVDKPNRFYNTYYGLLEREFDYIPENISNDFKLMMCKYEFVYYRAVLKFNDYEKLLVIYKDNIFYYNIKNNGYEKILFIIMAVCYTYYIGERELPLYVNKSEKNAAQQILAFCRENNFFGNFLQQIDWNYNTLISQKNIYKDFSNILGEFEELPDDGTVKICIMDKIINYFYLFISAFSYSTNYNSIFVSLLFENIGIEELYNCYFGRYRDETEKHLLDICDKLCNNDKQYYEKIKVGYSELENRIVSSYKENTLKKATRDFKKFDEDNKNNVVLNDIKERIISYLKQKYKDLSNETMNGEKYKFCVCRFTSPISFRAKEISDHMYSIIDTVIFDRLVELLKEKDILDIYERIYSNTDDEYIKFLENNRFKYMIGSDYIFRPQNYMKYQEFDNVIKKLNIKRISTRPRNSGLLFAEDAIAINIEDVEIEQKYVSLSDCEGEWEYNEETNMYKYPLDESAVEYTKEELSKYLHDSELAIEVNVSVNIYINENSHIFCCSRCNKMNDE